MLEEKRARPPRLRPVAEAGQGTVRRFTGFERSKVPRRQGRRQTEKVKGKTRSVRASCLPFFRFTLFPLTLRPRTFEPSNGLQFLCVLYFFAGDVAGGFGSRGGLGGRRPVSASALPAAARGPPRSQEPWRRPTANTPVRPARRPSASAAPRRTSASTDAPPSLVSLTRPRGAPEGFAWVERLHLEVGQGVSGRPFTAIRRSTSTVPAFQIPSLRSSAALLAPASISSLLTGPGVERDELLRGGHSCQGMPRRETVFAVHPEHSALAAPAGDLLAVLASRSWPKSRVIAAAFASRF